MATQIPARTWTVPIMREFQERLSKVSLKLLKQIEQLVDRELGLMYRAWALHQIYNMGGGKLIDFRAGSVFLESAGWYHLPNVIFSYTGPDWGDVEEKIIAVLELWQTRMVLEQFEKACESHMSLWGGSPLVSIMAEVYHTAGGLYLPSKLNNAMIALRHTFKRIKWNNYLKKHMRR